jgi:hypothetical protein
LYEETVPDEVEVSSPPPVKIIRDGKSVDTSAIDNYDSFMAYLMAAAQTAHLARIRRYYDDRTSIGEDQNWALQITPVSQEILCAHPSQSIYLVNDGPGEIFVTINALGRTPTHLFVHEQMFDNFETHKLYRFYVWSALGTIATARAKVKY